MAEGGAVANERLLIRQWAADLELAQLNDGDTLAPPQHNQHPRTEADTSH